MLNKYLKKIFETTKRGDAREESYYSCIEILLNEWIEKGTRKYQVTTLPKKTEAGNPDFRIWDGKQKIVGYIEAKAPTVENLDEIEESEQLRRYKQTFPNLILTNFFEFRLYRDGNLIKKVNIGRPFVLFKLDTIPPVENSEDFNELLKQFFSFSVPKFSTAKQLAFELAKRTRFLRDQLNAELTRENTIEGTQDLEGFYKTFKEYLISSLTSQEFSNLFAQTITFGLFVARSRSKEDFNRETAIKFIPRTIGILKKVFQFVSSAELPMSIKIIDDIAEILAVTDVRQIIRRFYHENKGSDPIIHFYETFLSEYDPKEREKRGVYYTPESVVSYIVRSVNLLLKDKFDKADGFATNSVTVLDPAAGTLTFPAKAIQIAIEEYKNKYGDGGIKGLIKDHILKNFYAFELMMAPYVIGHLKMSFLFEEKGYQIEEDDRFKLFLTNTLEMKELAQTDLPLFTAIADESHQASIVKKQKKIIVVIGNPPYSVSSLNKIDKENELFGLYESYKEKVRKEERNIQPLSDDYIKFIAFAHYKINQTGEGIIGMITNNSYLDGIIHRDMRRKLMEDFNQIYILNIHGNSKRQEKNPHGGKDQNVFDIQQGVSIVLLVKGEKLIRCIKYYDLWGSREKKYKFLENHDVKNTSFEFLSPKEPYNFFVKKDFKLQSHYKRFISLKDVFNEFNCGSDTARDKFIISEDKNSLFLRLKQFSDLSLPDEIIRSYGLKDTNKWFLSKARKKFSRETMKDSNFEEYSYKPFSNNWIYWSPIIIHRPKENFRKKIGLNNLIIISTRLLSSLNYQHVFVTDKYGDKCFISNRGKETNYYFPLYICNEESENELKFRKNFRSSNIKWSNLPSFYGSSCRFISSLTNNRIGDEEGIFYYIYAILYSNIYRQKYREFLKIDFPKIPFTDNFELFKRLSSLGEVLASLHLLKTPELNSPAVKFIGEGDCVVKEIKYLGNRLYINHSQFFGLVSSNEYNYFIGGYQVLNKWLKDRKGRALSSENIKHFCRVITAIKKTISIQERIDKLYPEVEKTLNEN